MRSALFALNGAVALELQRGANTYIMLCYLAVPVSAMPHWGTPWRAIRSKRSQGLQGALPRWGARWRAIRIEFSQWLPHGLPQGPPLGRPLRLPLGLPQGLPQGLDFCTHKSIDSHVACAPVKLLKSLFLHTPNRWIHMLLGCAFEGHGWLLFVQPDRWIHMLFASSGSAFKRLHYAGRS